MLEQKNKQLTALNQKKNNLPEILESLKNSQSNTPDINSIKKKVIAKIYPLGVPELKKFIGKMEDTLEKDKTNLNKYNDIPSLREKISEIINGEKKSNPQSYLEVLNKLNTILNEFHTFPSTKSKESDNNSKEKTPLEDFFNKKFNTAKTILGKSEYKKPGITITEAQEELIKPMLIQAYDLQNGKLVSKHDPLIRLNPEANKLGPDFAKNLVRFQDTLDLILKQEADGWGNGF